MKLQTKFNLILTIIFAVLAAGITLISINYVNTNTIREAENRVKIYMTAAWEILNSKTGRVASALDILSQSPVIINLLATPGDDAAVSEVRDYLESVRREQGMDILTVMDANGTVVLRTRSPYNVGDSLAEDPLVKQVLTSQKISSGYIILPLERLDVEGNGLIERCMAVGGEPQGMLAGAATPVFHERRLVGVIQMGSLLNGAAEKVDRIRDAVFKNEYYSGKPVGTATIFMGDLRISTNVLDKQGRRAVGTRVSKEVAAQVLERGLPWTGRAFVVDTWYLSQYDPIRDPDDRIIGMLYVGELEQKYLDMRTQAVISHLTVILAGMVLAFLAFYFVVEGILEPIRRLSDAIHRVASGELTYRVEVTGRDEIGGLAASFNIMAGELEKQRQEIERRQRELEKLSEELRITNQNYIAMLGFVTHEMKNPLTSATMSLYTVKDGYLGELNPAQKKSLEAVARSLDHFHDLLKNYLDLSRLEQGNFTVNKQPVVLNADIIAPTLEALSRELEEWRMVVSNEVPDDLTCTADPNLLRIVYDNLLSNAIKYGREGGSIVLDAHASNGKITLSVQNEGEGIPPDKMPFLFKKFSRLDAPAYASRKGTGLGLYICKEIIERHGGEIWADSKPGVWVKFSFTLPNQ